MSISILPYLSVAYVIYDNIFVPLSCYNGLDQQIEKEVLDANGNVRLINDKTMIPLRFLSEEMGYTVTLDEATRTAVIE